MSAGGGSGYERTPLQGGAVVQLNTIRGISTYGSTNSLPYSEWGSAPSHLDGAEKGKPQKSRRQGKNRQIVPPGPQMLGANPGLRRKKLVFSIVCIAIVVLVNFVGQMFAAGTMLMGLHLPKDATVALRIAVGACGLLIASLAVLFISTTASLLYVMYNYREEKGDLNVLTMGIAPEHLPSVDVFLPRYKEPWDLFKPTVEAALNLEYPGRVEVYVLDDGADPDLRNALTHELGLGTRAGLHYTVREDRRYAKAGNMQHGLRVADGELVCCFDADMRATPDFLLRVVPHIMQYDQHQGRWVLSDEVGLVQVPQGFYNSDDPLVEMMDGNMRHLMRCLYPAYNGLGVAPCIGTGYLAQRAVIDEVGGFTCGLAVEDVTTMAIINAAGWQSRFVYMHVVEGLSPTTLAEFYDQRFRWTAGQMQLVWYQRFLLQNVPVKPIWGHDWDERVRKGVPGIGPGAAFAWMPMVVYALIPAAAMCFMFCTLMQQIILDYRDDRKIPVVIGLLMDTIIVFFCFGLVFPIGRFGDVMVSIRSMYVYMPVFLKSLWWLMTGQMDPLKNPRFKASSEAYGGGFPNLAWVNVAVCALGWVLLGVDVYMGYARHVAAGMWFSISAEAVFVVWITWAMAPVWMELPQAFKCGGSGPGSSIAAYKKDMASALL